MFKGADDLLKFIADEHVEFIDVRFCDLPGVMQHFVVPASGFGPEAFTEGLAFDGSSVKGFATINESDMALMPDPSSAWLDPFREHKTLIINFFVHNPITKEPYSRDPRNIARKAQAYLGTTGIGDTAFFAPEAEFYVFDDVRYETNGHQSFYSVDAEAAAWTLEHLLTVFVLRAAVPEDMSRIWIVPATNGATYAIIATLGWALSHLLSAMARLHLRSTELEEDHEGLTSRNAAPSAEAEGLV